MSDDDHRDPSRWAHEPYQNPVDRFAHLPKPTRKWLENLREEDLREIIEAVRFYQTVKRGGSIFKWVIITFVATFVASVQFGEAILKFWGWISHGGSR